MAHGVVGDAEEAQVHRGRRSRLHRGTQGPALPLPGGGPQSQGGHPCRVPPRQEEAPSLRSLLAQERRCREPRQQVSPALSLSFIVYLVGCLIHWGKKEEVILGFP